MTAVIALLAGMLFGAGLLLSGMTNPANIIAFLDVAGHWQVSLVLTMAAAIVVALPAFAYVRRRGRSLGGNPIVAIDRLLIDRPLLLGSAIFGIGWGLSGICPGPGLVLLTSLDPRAFVFVAGVSVGALAMTLARRSGRPAGATLP